MADYEFLGQVQGAGGNTVIDAERRALSPLQASTYAALQIATMLPGERLVLIAQNMGTGVPQGWPAPVSLRGEQGLPGEGLPPQDGVQPGSVLTTESGLAFWAPAQTLPGGGEINDVLTKTENGYEWQPIPVQAGGTGGGTTRRIVEYGIQANVLNNGQYVSLNPNDKRFDTMGAAWEISGSTTKRLKCKTAGIYTVHVELMFGTPGGGMAGSAALGLASSTDANGECFGPVGCASSFTHTRAFAAEQEFYVWALAATGAPYKGYVTVTDV